MDEDRLTLDLDDGTSIETLIEGYFDYADSKYIVLSNIEDDELYIYKIVNETAYDFEIEPILDEFEFEHVLEEFDRIVSNS